MVCWAFVLAYLGSILGWGLGWGVLGGVVGFKVLGNVFYICQRVILRCLRVMF
jgi:hypothetical protein